MGRLAVRVTPGAREEALAIDGGKLSAKVRARPSDGEANAAVIALIARALGVPKRRVELLRGATSREKLLRVPLDQPAAGFAYRSSKPMKSTLPSASHSRRRSA